MASFRGHVTLGVASGLLLGVSAYSIPQFADAGFVFMLFWLTVLGSFLPDMDSDSGLPFNISFGALSLVSTALVFSYVFHQYPENLILQIFIPLLSLGFVWVILGAVVKKMTRHRGMAHSIPSAVLSGLVIFFLAQYLNFTDAKAFWLGLGIFLGYMGHLILDEIWAVVNFQGKLFVPNKALGSALKLYSDSRFWNALLYGGIVFFASGNTQRFFSLAQEFWRSVDR